MTKKKQPKLTMTALRDQLRLLEKDFEVLRQTVIKFSQIAQAPNCRMDSLEGGFAEMIKKFHAYQRGKVESIPPVWHKVEIKTPFLPTHPKPSWEVPIEGETESDRAIRYWKGRALAAEELLK